MPEILYKILILSPLDSQEPKSELTKAKNGGGTSILAH